MQEDLVLENGSVRGHAYLPVAPIKPVAIVLSQAPVAEAEGSVEPAAGEAPARSITPADFGKLGNLNLTAYAVDFSRVELPKGSRAPTTT